MTASSAFLLWILLASTPFTDPFPAGNESFLVTRHLELTEEREAVVSLSLQHPTSLVFDAPLQPSGVEVEDTRMVAVAVNEAQGLVTLMPSDAWVTGKPLFLRVRFADGTLPERGTLKLELSLSGTAHQVRVYRRSRSGPSYQHDAQQQRERAERCEVQLARVQMSPTSHKGLADVLDTGLVQGGQGILAQDISKTTRQKHRTTLQVRAIYSYRADAMGRVAMEFWVENTGARPWQVREATLENPEQRLRLRVLRVEPHEPLPPGEKRRVLVEAEATEAQARGHFELGLGEEGGPPSFVLKGVTFP